MPENKLPKEFINSAQKCGINPILTQDTNIPRLYVESNKVISVQKIPGLKISTESFKEGANSVRKQKAAFSNGVKIKMVVKKGVSIKKPIFLCFGVLGEKGKQIILPEIVLEEKAEAKIFAHCTFPQAKKVSHQMEAKIKLKKNARLAYQEKHYHGENFGAEVLPNFKVSIGPEAIFENEFILNQGSVGKLKIVLEAELKESAFCKIVNKVIGNGKRDNVEIYDKILLSGKDSRSLNKLRGVAVSGGKMFFRGETEAGIKAKNARGHIDCQEIVVGNSTAQSIPVVTVKNPEARITHEASVGKVNQKELETLMTRGLSESQAIDFIIRGRFE